MNAQDIQRKSDALVKLLAQQAESQGVVTALQGQLKDAQAALDSFNKQVVTAQQDLGQALK